MWGLEFLTWRPPHPAPQQKKKRSHTAKNRSMKPKERDGFVNIMKQRPLRMPATTKERSSDNFSESPLAEPPGDMSTDTVSGTVAVENTPLRRSPDWVIQVCGVNWQQEDPCSQPLCFYDNASAVWLGSLGVRNFTQLDYSE